MRIAAIALAMGLALVSACSGPANVKEAEAKVAVFHRNLDTGNYDAVWRDSSEEMTGSESKQALAGLLSSIHGRMGKVKTSEKIGWKVNYDNGVGTTQVTMKTTFEKGALEEEFLFRNTDAGLKLAGYKFEQK